MKIFDGQNHTISGLKISDDTLDVDTALGLFGVLDGGSVSNVTVKGNINVKRGNGGIVGKQLACGKITDCKNDADIDGESGKKVGLICGYVEQYQGVQPSYAKIEVILVENNMEGGKIIY